MSTPTPEQQRRARIFGVLFAGTFITSIAGLLLYDPVLNDADYILGDGADTRVQLGALCEIFLAITAIGTAVVIWPIVRRQSETLALSFVASRIVESVIILVGGPMIFASCIAVLLGAYEQDGAHFLFAIPEIIFELSITIYTISKGFRPSPILDDNRYARAGEGSGRAALAPQ